MAPFAETKAWLLSSGSVVILLIWLVGSLVTLVVVTHVAICISAEARRWWHLTHRVGGNSGGHAGDVERSAIDKDQAA